MPKFVVRDCSYLSGPDKKCGDFNLDPMNLKDARGFNGCVILCNGTLCNSTPSRHLTGFQFWWFTSLLSFFALFLLGIQWFSFNNGPNSEHFFCCYFTILIDINFNSSQKELNRIQFLRCQLVQRTKSTQTSGSKY